MRLSKGFKIDIVMNTILVLSYEGRVIRTYNLPKEIIHAIMQDIKGFMEDY